MKIYTINQIKKLMKLRCFFWLENNSIELFGMTMNNTLSQFNLIYSSASTSWILIFLCKLLTN